MQLGPRNNWLGPENRPRSCGEDVEMPLQKHSRQSRKNAVDSMNGNSLFIRPDTVVKYIAHQRGVSQRAVIDGGADVGHSSAVRLALGEAQLLADANHALEKEGVDIAALTSATDRGAAICRSDTTILVKNLPFSCEIAAIRTLFAQHGALGRVVLPPSRAFGLVEFVRPADARRAFRALAYRRLKSVPLYLEWAPRGSFHSRPACPPASGEVVHSGRNGNALHQQSAATDKSLRGQRRRSANIGAAKMSTILTFQNFPSDNAKYFAKTTDFEWSFNILKEVFTICILKDMSTFN